ncbi:FAD-dependent oxidoreductase [Spartinivicinus poritis]|uniref:FAD-dependent oxidoreductase n=1 Tax=Spartinivicinus poritis TaxID=2994640 RepID=A0ABT5U6K1_9GAMM|nr:FAD-dependent oxidoreductase [Spartinivicinus sp. A2-2]MDE1462003.1 FAD-dependent oxidoreductase [Spartinivicinus sp. A2-2]
MNVAIIGAGIYGCHLALSLKNNNINIDLYDMADDIFAGASTYNSFRIHKGYHYPRSSKTRNLCKKDEAEFVARYAELVQPESTNPKIFCVASDSCTLIDFETMKIIMRGAGLPFDELSLQQLKYYGFENIEGGFIVNESILLVDKAKKWFKDQLEKAGVCLKLNTYLSEVQQRSAIELEVAGKVYDFVINCTYNQSIHYNSLMYKYHYDLCFSLVVASKLNEVYKKPYSFGIFDGAYPSLEPFGYNDLPDKYVRYTGTNLFQLFHVKYTSIKKYNNIHEARKAYNKPLSSSELKAVTKKMLDHTCYFYPKFNHEFEIIDYTLSLKTKVDDLSDNRPLIVCQDFSKHRRLIQVFSSKLTSVISAERAVKNIITKEY